MVTPYDWQEGIANRASYIESKLSHGAAVAMVSLDEGILALTYRRQARKLYEIYDRLLFGGMGQQADVENLRIAALEFAHREGYNRSSQDVTIQRLALGLSTPMRGAFSDFNSAPFVARILFAELGETPETDQFVAVDYDGDYALSRKSAVLAPGAGVRKALSDRIAEIDPATPVAEAREKLRTAWTTSMAEGAEASEEDLLEGLSEETLLMQRGSGRQNRFRLLTPIDF